MYYGYKITQIDLKWGFIITLVLQKEVISSKKISGRYIRSCKHRDHKISNKR